jgi:hypothetical protein
MSLFLFFISLLIVAQHVSGNHVPIIRWWRLRDVIALCWYVPWLQGGCQVRLAGSASMDALPANRPYSAFYFIYFIFKFKPTAYNCAVRQTFCVYLLSYTGSLIQKWCDAVLCTWRRCCCIASHSVARWHGRIKCEGLLACATQTIIGCELSVRKTVSLPAEQSPFTHASLWGNKWNWFRFALIFRGIAVCVPPETS